MFDYIKGKITYVYAKNIVIENNGIGYIVYTPNSYNFKQGEDTCVYIYTHISENIYDLYGFSKIDERDLFVKLLSVKGIGPKGALAIIASGDLKGLEDAINNGDAKYLQKFPGIGAKSASQMILDLKGKLVNTNTGALYLDPKLESVKDALRSLGYSNSELKKLDSFLLQNKDLNIEDLVKMSLKKML